jgi:cell division protein FtsQ
MPPIAAPADKRFRRSHVKPSGKRASSRVRQAWIAVRLVAMLAVVAYAGSRGLALVSNAQTLEVGHIIVTGNDRLATGELLALLDGLKGRNIVGVDLVEWQNRLLSSPWVEEATLRRVFPATMEVRVRERTPMAIGRIGSALYLVDSRGAVVDEYGPAYKDLDLPIVDGLAPKGDAQRLDESRAALAARVIADLGAHPDLGAKVSQIDVSDAHDAVVMLDGDTTLLHVGESDFVERLQQYLDLGDALRERVASIDYVDLRFPERLYVRPAKGSARTPAAAQARR